MKSISIDGAGQYIATCSEDGNVAVRVGPATTDQRDDTGGTPTNEILETHSYSQATFVL